MWTRFVIDVAVCVGCMAFLVVGTPAAGSAAETGGLVASVVTVDGVITGVQGDDFTVRADDGSAQNFTVNIDTLYTQAGIASTREKTLKAGHKVAVTHKAGIALTVMAD